MSATAAPGPSGPLSGEQGATLRGRWAELTDAGAHPPEAIEALLAGLGLRPELAMPGVRFVLPEGSRFGAPAVITGTSTRQALGILTNAESRLFPGVPTVTTYMDQHRTRPACAMEAWGLYVDRIFALGASKIRMDVLAFNTTVHRLMATIGARSEAISREHFYIAGRFWDVTA
ncbi:MAG: hypothetical protein ACR2HY_01445 [Acidimicrobiales bacterium]